MRVTKVENPSIEEISELHDKYVAALTRLYEEYNPIYGDQRVKLVIT